MLRQHIRNAAFNVSIHDISILRKINWATAADDRADCAKKTTSLNSCDNFIRTFYPFESGFVLCGTHGLHPTCAEFLYNAEGVQRTFAGNGLAPFAQDIKAPFVYAANFLYTANAPHYSSPEPLILRKDTLRAGTNDILRTDRGERQFEGAQFVGLIENGHEILSFFSEPPSESEGCGLRRVARVGRVCRSDPGGQGKHQNEWTSFVKARLDCYIEEKDQDTLYFNQLASICPSTRSFFGAFRSQLAGLGASAVCMYSRATISRQMGAVFNNSRISTCPRAIGTYEHIFIRSNPLIQKRMNAAPIFVHYGQDRFQFILVQEDVIDLFGRRNTVLFIATDQGRVFKVVQNEEQTTASHVATFQVVQLQPSSPIQSISLHSEQLPNQQLATSLLVLTNNKIIRLPSSTCAHIFSCSQCLSLGDPECAWINHGAECVVISQNLHRRQYLNQELRNCPEIPVTTERPIVQSKET
uniref:Sema domain-containing protein n=1 Tax=Heterorhabditis bacteriophora TaxID=37862 RepID=A0A1I7XQ88_HETBA